MLEKLRKLNPGLPFYSIEDAAFRRFGRVIDYPAQGLIDACRRAVQMPESGSRYVTDLPELETPELFEPAARVLRGGWKKSRLLESGPRRDAVATS